MLVQHEWWQVNQMILKKGKPAAAQYLQANTDQVYYAPVKAQKGVLYMCNIQHEECDITHTVRHSTSLL